MYRLYPGRWLTAAIIRKSGPSLAQGCRIVPELMARHHAPNTRVMIDGGVAGRYPEDRLSRAFARA
jgi:hypothetical protein